MTMITLPPGAPFLLGQYVHLVCACGHQVTEPGSRFLRYLNGARDFSALIPRLRCSRCGRRGRPEIVISSYSQDETQLWARLGWPPRGGIL